MVDTVIGLYYSTMKLMSGKCSSEQYAVLDQIMWRGVNEYLKQELQFTQEQVNSLLLVYKDGNVPSIR